MVAEVIWVFVFGIALAWLQANSSEPDDIDIAEDTWDQWEREVHDWELD